MKKISLAVGHRQLEEFLENKLRNEFQFVGATVYREGILRSISQTTPDIIVIRETLDGKENIMDIVYNIQVQFPYVRVIFIAGDRAPGDELLSSLVNYGVYDILHGAKVSAPDIMRLIRQPNTRKDVAYLQPKPVLDERKNKMLFNTPEHAPTERVIIKEVVKEVFVDPQGDVVHREPLYKQPEEEEEYEEYRDYPEELDEEEPESSRETFDASAEEPKSKEPNKRKLFPQRATPVFSEPAVKTPEAKPEKEKKSRKKSSLFAFPTMNAGTGMAREGGVMLSFVGAKHGLGTTSIAVSVAAALSEKHKVLFVEMDDHTPATPYWYEISSLTKGIEAALEAVGLERLQDVEKEIVKMREMKQDSSMQRVHKRFSDNMDFLTFSKRYVARKEGEYEDAQFEHVKDLYLYLLFQTDYDYIVLDVPPYFSHPATHFAMMYSQRIFMLLTQDVSTIGQADFALHELEKSGQDIRKKTQFVLNKHENSSISVKDVEKWLKISKVITIPNANKEFIHASFNGLTMFTHGRSSQWRTIWKNLLKSI